MAERLGVFEGGLVDRFPRGRSTRPSFSMIVRAARRLERPAQSEIAQASLTPVIAVHGAAPEEATRLEAFLRPVATVLGLPLVEIIIPGRPWVRQLERGVLVRVPRPDGRLVAAALVRAVLGSAPAAAPRQERRRQATKTGGTQQARRPRPDIDAAIGIVPEGEAQ